MLPQETIRRKRDGLALDAPEIADFIDGLSKGTIADSQVAAFAMAVWYSGMTSAETVALTLAMRDSGDVLDWSDIGRPVADKHSTGGVGDNVSLMLAPIAAACGLAVPMISGRGLGHTGGTLDKLEAIPGYDVIPSSATFRAVVREAGSAIIGQTGDLAPADRRLYAIRDVTATVDSVPLITASILSKKLAAGLQSLVLDVKIGNGAFMTTQDAATTLARSLVDVANGAGVRTMARLTDMNQPLADAVGNGLEIAHCVAFLKGEKAGSRSETVVMAFASDMLVLSGIVADHAGGQAMARRALDSGQALDRFARMVHGLGGPGDFVERPEKYLRQAPVTLTVEADRDGYLAACDTLDMGMTLIALGGGRVQARDPIDHSVGMDRIQPLGTRVARGDPIAVVHASSPDAAETARARIARAYTITDAQPDIPPVLRGEIT